MLAQATLAPRFTGGPYGPGDTVEGAIVAGDAIDDLRAMNLYLRYVATSPSFSSGETHDSLVPFHEGSLAQGQEVPFALRIPEDALPNWEDPRTSDYGSLTWALAIETDIAGRLDRVVTRPVPVDRTGRAWPGPAPANQPNRRDLVDDWDVSIEPDRWSVHRGEEVTFTLRIGKPKAGREKLEVLFAGQLRYRVEIREPTSSTGEFKNVNRTEILFLEEPAIDPSLPEQSFTVRVPEDGPWSHDGDVVKFYWFAVAKEKRRWFQSDAGREAHIEVLP